MLYSAVRLVLSRVQLFATPRTVARQAPLSVGILQARILEWVAMPSSRGNLPNSGIEPRSPSLQADSLPAEPQEKPKNSGLGSLSHLQQIFLIQGSNWHPLHCRWILYQLSYQEAIRCFARQLKLNHVKLNLCPSSSCPTNNYLVSHYKNRGIIL